RDGGVWALHSAVRANLGRTRAKQFVEVLFAPGYDRGALTAFEAKPGIRVLADAERRSFVTSERDFQRVLGGLLVQDRDTDGDPLDAMDVVCGDPGAAMWDDLLFAWTIAKHVVSNAIVIARGGQALGN